MVVSGVSDERDVRIYIDDVLHVIIPRPNVLNSTRDSILLQSYKSENNCFYIEIETERGKMRLEYVEEKLWKEVLTYLDDLI